VGPALMLAVMIVAAITVHWPNGLFTASHGIELPLLYATGAFGLALVGLGPFSLDALLGIEFVWTPAITWIALAAGIIAGLANLALRRRPAPARGT
jgi:putative oxidoreductase